MKIAIVEDELLAVTYLKNLLEEQSIVDISSITILRSTKQATEFFRENAVDLIFMDIHLGDGKSFEIFQEVEILTPIIFITAYDEYAMKVFKHFTIDYILKPFEVEELHIALQKFETIRTSFDISPTLQSIAVLENSPSEIMHRFLVTNGNKLRSVEEHEIAYFFASGKSSGSLSYTPSTLVPFSIASASISIARSAAPESVEKYGLPVPPEKIHTYF